MSRWLRKIILVALHSWQTVLAMSAHENIPITCGIERTKIGGEDVSWEGEADNPLPPVSIPIESLKNHYHLKLPIYSWEDAFLYLGMCRCAVLYCVAPKWLECHVGSKSC